MRIGKAVALIGVFSLGLLIGASMTIALAGIDLDEGLSTLLGSAFGSAIAIAGAWWVATQQDRIAHEEFERFACDVVKDLHRASMIGMSVGGDLEHLDRNNSDWERYETRYRAQLDSISDILGIFDKHVAATPGGSYKLRLALAELERNVAFGRKALSQREINAIVKRGGERAHSAYWGQMASLQTGCQGFLAAMGRESNFLDDQEMARAKDHIDLYNGGMPVGDTEEDRLTRRKIDE